MLKENIALAMEALKANKMRSFLTMIGIIIGITSVIAIITIGNALTASISNELDVFGTNNISVTVEERSEIGLGMGEVSTSMNRPDDKDLITDEAINQFKNLYADEIEGISLNHTAGSAVAKDGAQYANVTVTGVNADYEIVEGVSLADGRFISDQDVKDCTNAAVVSDKFATAMFSDEADPIGQNINVYGSNSIKRYTIIGVFKYETSILSSGDSIPDEDIRTKLFIPVSTAKQTSAYKNHNNLSIKVTKDVDPVVFSDKIEDYFKSYYVNNVEWDVSVDNLSGLIDTINTTMSLVSIAISIIAGISLVVGGIGVMNIMLVSVTERTTEIGIRKALGARNVHVRIQFVIEAGIITLIGGLIGIAFGMGIGLAASTVLGAPAFVSPYIIMMSVGFSAAIGLFFGYYPANKAAQLDPIDALRFT